MNKTVVFTLLMAFALFSGTVNAQTLTSASNATDKSQVSASQKLENVSSDVGHSSDAQEAKSDDDDFLVGVSKKNFGGASGSDKEEKKYDNTYSKVAHMRIVDGKVVFDDDRFILVYYEDFKVEQGFDGITRCSMRIHVFNDLTERINNLAMKLKWPEISTNVQMTKVNQGVSTYMDIMLLGDGCLSMDKAPTIEVNRCRVKGMSEDKCADAIRWFKKNQ